MNIWRKLEEISLVQQEHGSMLAAILEQVGQMPGNIIRPTYEFPSGTFPCTTLEGLNNLEQLLLDQEPAFIKLVSK